MRYIHTNREDKINRHDAIITPNNGYTRHRIAEKDILNKDTLPFGASKLSQKVAYEAI